MTSQQRDSIALTKIEKYIDGQIDDVLVCPDCQKEHGAIKELSTAAVALIRSRYDKLRPTLSSSEVTHLDPNDSKSEDELYQDIRRIIAADPHALAKLGLVLAPSNAEQQTQH